MLELFVSDVYCLNLLKPDHNKTNEHKTKTGGFFFPSPFLFLNILPVGEEVEFM